MALEVKTARQLRHPNVCRVFDFGHSDGGQAFVVMELATNTLRDELDRPDYSERSIEQRLADARAVAAGQLRQRPR